jgi:tetratricopeptide (TPR) repeat protein
MGSSVSICAPRTISDPFSVGVKIAVIVEELKKGSSDWETATTADICEKIIKPMTGAYQCSLAEYLAVMSPSTIGKPCAFISHAWKFKFKDLIAALVSYFGEDEYVWLDLVCNNQHKAANYDFEWWSGTFKNAIASIGKTVMVFDEWNDPIPLTRGWCIWELYCTIDNELCEFDVAMTAHSEISFVEDMDESAHDAINKMLGTIDCARSECFNDDDRMQIHDAVKRTLGFSKMNKTIFEVMRSWVIRKYEKETEIRKEELGEMHPDTLGSMNQLSLLYSNQGNYEKAEPLLVECLKNHKLVLGDTHPDTLTLMNNLALLYRNQGKYDVAEPLYVECLEMEKSVLGDEHPDTLLSLNNLAELYRIQGKYDKAEPLYVECLQMKKSVLGDEHPSTLASMNNLAALYKNQGKYDKAGPLYVECLEKSKSVLGEAHPETLGAMNNLAAVYDRQGKFEEAEPLHVECLEKYKSVLGDAHPDTLKSINNLALLYHNQGKYEKAEPLFEEAVSTAKRVLGDSHPWTVAFEDNYSQFTASIRKPEEVETLH